MAEIIIDRVTTLSAQERYGTLVGMTRQLLISGLTETNFGALLEALNELNFAPGDALVYDNKKTMLILAERNPSIVGGDPTKAEVELIYEHALGDGQALKDNPYGEVLLSSSSSLQQIRTNKDNKGNQIFLEHTYPDGTDTYKVKYTKVDKDGNETEVTETLPADPDFPGELKQQSGEIEVTVPQEIITVQGLYPLGANEQPFDLRKAMINHVNDQRWQGGDARTWLCISADYDWYNPIGSSKFLGKSNSKTVFYTFQFQHNVDGWDPDVIFIDPRTGKSPPALQTVEDAEDKEKPDYVGIRTVKWYSEQDFDEKILIAG